MEQLLRDQTNVAFEIQRLYHAALAATREKGGEYILKLKTDLVSRCDEFNRNHERLDREKTGLKNDKYFKENTAGRVMTLRDAAIVKLDTLLESKGKYEQNSRKEAPDCAMKEQSGVMNKNSGVIRKFQFALSDLEQKINSFTANECDLDELKKTKETAQSIFYDYTEKFPDDDLVAGFYDLKELYEKLPKIKSMGYDEVPFQMPSLEIPMFDGDYSKWDTFRELFEQLILSRNMSNVQKMCILKSKVKGDAARCIMNLPSTSTNFEVAWKILQQQFSNKRIIANAYLRKLFDSPEIGESMKEVKEFLSTIKESTQALNTLEMTAEEMTEAILSFVLLRKFNTSMRLKFEMSLQNSREIPKLDDILKFLEHEFTALESVEKLTNFSQLIEVKNKVTPQKMLTKCIMECKIPHYLNQCSKFRAMSVNDRWAKIISNKLCIKCLRRRHLSKNCMALTCKICKKNHHMLLHSNVENKIFEKTASVQDTKQEKIENCVLLSTAIINVKDANDKFIKARALLDSGSQVNLMSANLKNKLRLKPQKCEKEISGIGTNKSKINQQVNVVVKSTNNEFTTNLNFLVVSKILSDLPSEKIQKGNIPNDYKLADPTFDIPQKVDILLGAEIFYSLMKKGQVQIESGNFTLQNSVLGWIACGSAKLERTNINVCATAYENQPLEEQLRKFWELEEINTINERYTKEELKCEQLFKDSVKLNSDGKFLLDLHALNSITVKYKR